MLHEGRYYSFRILLFYFGQQEIPRLAFDSRRNITVVDSTNEIAFLLNPF
jgi:hypothetical protein